MNSIFELLKNPTYLFDSHAHLSEENDSEIETILKNCTESRVELIFNMGVSLESSKKVVLQAKKYSKVKAFVGIDPEVVVPGSGLFQANFNIEKAIFELDLLIEGNSENISGIGESGMDDHWTRNLSVNERDNSLKLQDALFLNHMELAAKYNLPISLHSRKVEAILLEKVKAFKNVYGIFHSYTGDYETAKGIIDLGWGIGVNGIATFKNSIELKSVFKRIIGKMSGDTAPSDFYSRGIFFETDSPFLSPEGMRGQKNNPSNTAQIYEQFVKFLME